MLERLVIAAIIIGAGYWYYTGPYQAQTDPNEGQQLQTLQEEVARCIKSKDYKQGATGDSEGDPTELCAREFNVFMHDDGLWHSYSKVVR